MTCVFLSMGTCPAQVIFILSGNLQMQLHIPRASPVLSSVGKGYSWEQLLIVRAGAHHPNLMGDKIPLSVKWGS